MLGTHGLMTESVNNNNKIKTKHQIELAALLAKWCDFKSPVISVVPFSVSFFSAGNLCNRLRKTR